MFVTDAPSEQRVTLSKTKVFVYVMFCEVVNYAKNLTNNLSILYSMQPYPSAIC